MANPVIDSRQLLAFRTLARTGSFTRTAQELFLSQSAISHSIKALEQELGCQLFHRMGKNAQLTESGEILRLRAEQIILSMQEARDSIEASSQWGRGRLRIGTAATICQYILPEILREFRQCFDECRIHITQGDTPELLRLLQANEIDLAIALAPEGSHTVEVHPLFEDELRLLLSPLHPWVQAGRMDRTAVDKQPFIFYNKGSYTFEAVSRHFAHEGLRINSLLESPNMEAIKELVKIGLGVSVVAPWIAEAELAEGSLAQLPLGRAKMRRQWALLTPRGRPLTLAEETFSGLSQSISENLALRHDSIRKI